MKRTTAALVGLAAAVVAAGFAVPAALAAGGGAPAATVADAPGSGQALIDWNRRLLAILGTPGAQPAAVHPTRSLAMLQAAEFDAVVSITHAAPPYRASLSAPGDARPDAAADQAAHDVLVALYPTMRADLDAQLSGELAGMPQGPATQHGTEVGAEAARQIVAARAGDGSAAPAAPFTAGSQPGDYRPTPPKFLAPMYPNWGSVAPFLLSDPNQFRPAAPPPVSSPEYAAALAEVAQLGRDTSTTRTPDETVAGRFWSATPIWTTWNQVAEQLAAGHSATLSQASGMFAALDLALADSTVAMYAAKYDDHVWRPVTALQLGVEAGSTHVPADPAWTPLTTTAADPSYPGAHSTLSAAAATVLTAFYGPRQPVAITSSADPGVTRSFATLAQAADEAGLSRIWAGQHTRLDDRSGRQLGTQVAGLVLADLRPPGTA